MRSGLLDSIRGFNTTGAGRLKKVVRVERKIDKRDGLLATITNFDKTKLRHASIVKREVRNAQAYYRIFK